MSLNKRKLLPISSRACKRIGALVCLGFILLSCEPCQSQSTDDSVWRGEILPVIQRACLDCHSGTQADGSLDLEQFRSLDQVVDARRLWQKVAGRVQDRQMPPSDGPELSEADRATLVNWIQSELPGIPCRHPQHAGAVTIRRLTRTEYANTVRDLLQVEFDPKDTFPADESGYGFDNIGDVLSISPMLLEKYLGAAEQISRQVIDDPDRHRVDVTTSAAELPAVPGSRIIDSGQIMTTNGTITVPVTLSRAGKYRLTVQAWADQAGDEIAKMGISANGKLVAQQEVQAERDAAGEFEFDLELDANARQIGISFLNDYYNPGAKNPRQRDRNLGIRAIQFGGPLDAQDPAGPEKHFLFELPGDDQSPEQAARKIIKLHGSRAWRRPLRPSEIDQLQEIYRAGIELEESFQSSMQLVLQAMLVSPHFLFKVEHPAPADGSLRRLDDFELATSLSYFLWGTMPDNRLFQRATGGQLTDPEILATETTRMLADPRSVWLVENFAGQWLQLRILEQMDPDPEMFSDFNSGLREAMMRETRLLLNDVIRDDAPLPTLLNARYTWLNRALAKHYGLPVKGLREDEFRRVELQDSLRGGILTHGSFLTLTSNPTRTSPVKRGKWVLDNLLADPPPPPLPDVPQLDNQNDLHGSLRERMEQHRADPNCAVCHYKMDSIGFALESFDAIGRFREVDDQGQPIDSAGSLPGDLKFSGPRELQAVILNNNYEAFVRCFVEKMFTFAIGRGPTATDDCIIDSITRDAISGEQPVSGIIQALVASEPFQYRCRPIPDPPTDEDAK